MARILSTKKGRKRPHIHNRSYKSGKKALVNKNIPKRYKKITCKQFLHGDFDGDGVKNKDDCYPFDKNRQDEIPSTTLSGGILKDFGGAKAVEEYRVWLHPHSGSDTYRTYKTLKEAEMDSIIRRKSGKYSEVEVPLAVVFDKKFKRYREVDIERY